jgi:hypothetical protein
VHFSGASSVFGFSLKLLICLSSLKDIAMLTTAFETQALCLPLSDRAELASKLIASLDDMQEAETESLWLDLAQDRATQLDGNPNLGISFEHSDAKLRAILARQP